MGKSKEEYEKEKTEIETLLSQIEEEYRKAAISENVYKEMKEKYEKKLREINKKLGIKEGKKEGFFTKVLKKGEKTEKSPYESENKGEPVFFDPLNPPKEILEEVKPEEKPKEIAGAPTEILMEIERFKASLEAFREEKKVLTEQIRNLSESIGELRSMLFQTDASVRELEIKIDKALTQIEEISPEKISKGFLEFEKKLEKFNIFIEKTEKELESLTEKVNKIFELVKTSGSIENIIETSKDISKKVKEVKDAINYIERIAVKVEKNFIETSKNLQEFLTYKTRQEGLEDTVKEILKSLDAINSKIENLATNKDLDSVKVDIARIDTQLKEFEKVLPLMETKLPETIKTLRNERDELVLFLNTLETQLKEGKISIGDYEKTSKATKERIKKIDEELINEWKKIEKFLELGGLETIPRTIEEEKKETKIEEEKKSEIGKIPVEIEEGYVELFPVKSFYIEEVKVESKPKIEKVEEIKGKIFEPVKPRSEEETKSLIKKLKKEI